MTVTELVNYFDLLQDKYGSPYFTTSEKESFLIRAELDLIFEHLPKEGDELNIERNANTWMIFNPISFNLTTNMNSSGIVLKSSLESTLTTSLGFDVEIIRPLSIGWEDADGTRPIMGPTRHNNWNKYKNNVFKEPVTSEPRYYETSTGYIIEPIDTNANITISGVRYPQPISVSGDVTSELSPIYHNELVARALELAGVGSRDQMLSELKKLNTV